MAQRCELCGKGPQFGNRISHAHNVTHRRFNPNLQRVRAVHERASSASVRVCTRCLRSGKVAKPDARSAKAYRSLSRPPQASLKTQPRSGRSRPWRPSGRPAAWIVDRAGGSFPRYRS